MDKYIKVLQKYWGYSQFRPLQDEIIASIGKGVDTLGLMPTGGGKSITFQVPALTMDGVCIVVTPLIALMKDQVDNLKKKNIKASAIYSGMSKDAIIVALENCILGDYKFLYISPERLATEIFQTKLKQMKVSMIAVDESHCISQWGYDFRPSYLKIADIRELLPNVPILALTATATPEVVKDIQLQLQFKNGKLFQKSFARKNIAYIVRNIDDKIGQMFRILESVPGTSIVYVRNRKKTKEIAEMLNNKNISAEHYHAGLSNESKDAKQKAWKDGSCRVIVATNAFGMGIDKPDVRTVIHLDIPDSLEAYFQEAGRAGRDELKAYGILLYNKSDITKLKKRVSDSFPTKDYVKQVYSYLCNFLQIAEGYGLDSVNPFDISSFCIRYKLPILSTFSALKILQQAGYIELTDEMENSSRLMFTCLKDDLYKNRTDEMHDNVIKLLLRSYTGLFSEYAYINEHKLSNILGISTDELYNILVTLSKNKIISYIPTKKTPFVIFSQERVGDRYLEIGKMAYDVRKERFENKISKTISYVTDDSRCRSKMLLAYFGEDDSKMCGCCDYCLAKKEKGISNFEFESIKENILKVIESEECKIFDITSKINSFNESKVIVVVRWMQDNSLIDINVEGCLKKR